MSTTEMVDSFVSVHCVMVDKSFPTKEIQVGPSDLPYFTEELRKLKRQRLRAYTLHGGKSVQYQQLKIQFDEQLKKEAIKYRQKIETEVKDGKRGSGYKNIRKLGNLPGESWQKQELILPTYVQEELTPQQSADQLAGYFSSISQSVEPLNENQFPPVVREAIEEGRTSSHKPVLSQHDVYRKIMIVTKPKSTVLGDIPTILLKRYPFEYAKPVTVIFNQIIQTSSWPRQWVQEQQLY